MLIARPADGRVKTAIYHVAVQRPNIHASIKRMNEAMYPPQIRRADYGRGFYFCSSCGKGYYNADKCPLCGTKTRKEGKKDNREDKPKVNIEGG